MIPAMATWTYPGARLGLLGRISQITDEPRFKGADRQEILGLIFKIIEPVLGHSAADDLPFEALVVNLKKVKTVANIKEIVTKKSSRF